VTTQNHPINCSYKRCSVPKPEGTDWYLSQSRIFDNDSHCRHYLVNEPKYNDLWEGNQQDCRHILSVTQSVAPKMAVERTGNVLERTGCRQCEGLLKGVPEPSADRLDRTAHLARAWFLEKHPIYVLSEAVVPFVILADVAGF